MEFDNGDMFMVRRPIGDADIHGDVEYADSHLIGPCAHDESGSSSDFKQERVSTTISVTAPTNSDVRATDMVRLPDGTLAMVDKARPRKNPFTGWAPFLTMTLSEVGHDASST